MFWDKEVSNFFSHFRLVSLTYTALSLTTDTESRIWGEQLCRIQKANRHTLNLHSFHILLKSSVSTWCSHQKHGKDEIVSASTVKEYERVRLWLLLLTSMLGRGEWTASHYGSYTPGKDRRRLGGSQSQSGNWKRQKPLAPAWNRTVICPAYKLVIALIMPPWLQ